MGFMGIGPLELMLIMAVALIAFGPHRLPELARHIAKAVKMFKDAGREIQNQLDQVDWEIRQQEIKKNKPTSKLSYDDSNDEEEARAAYEYEDYNDEDYDGAYPEPSPHASSSADYASASGNGPDSDAPVAHEPTPSEHNGEAADPAKVNDAQRYSREMGD